MTITWQLKTTWNALHNAYGLNYHLIRYLKLSLTFTEVISMLLACFTFFLWVPRVRGIVLPSFKEDFVSITSAFVCSVSLEDDGIRPSTFSLPHLPFTPQCSWPQKAIKRQETWKVVPSDMRINKARVLFCTGGTTLLQIELEKTYRLISAYSTWEVKAKHVAYAICFQYAHAIHFGVLG